MCFVSMKINLSTRVIVVKFDFLILPTVLSGCSMLGKKDDNFYVFQI